MCGRFAIALIAGHADTAEWLRIERDAPPPDWLDGWPPDPAWPSPDQPPAGPWPRPSWNIAPTQSIAAITAGETPDAPRRVIAARWGLVPRWWNKPLAAFKATTFNARSEEAAGKPMFRDAWARARCLIPAAGYYEWTGKAGAKTPWYITRRSNRPGLCFAGLWAEARVDGARLVSATILTTAAGEATRHLHPRSPVVLEEEDFDAWLTGGAGEGGEAAALMRPIEDARTVVQEVDRAVGNVRNDDPGMVAPVGLGL
ncbi:MAG: SOS response-associated peptidase [Pseudomonadota bacterium]